MRESDNYLIIHKDSSIDLNGANSGAETATLALAEYLAQAGKSVVVAGILKGTPQSSSKVQFWDMGTSFDIVELATRARELGPYNLISAGRAIPFFVFRKEPLCRTRVLISHDRSGHDTGVKPEVLETLVDKVICVSHAQAEVLKADGVPEHLIKVIHNGVNLDIFQPGNIELRDWHNLVFSGALIPDKGIHFLIDAFAELKSKYPNLSLDVYGSASLWGRSEMFDSREISNQFPSIRFHGRVQQSQIAEGFKGAGLCVVPSIWFDPFPLTSLEAQVTGCPVLAFDQGGLAEGIKDGVTGVVVKEVSVQALVAGLDKLLSTPELLKSMSQNALSWARGYFNWERVAGDIVCLCDELSPTRILVNDEVTPEPISLQSTEPLISVVTVSYNHAEYIRQNIESVLSQNYKNFEHIIIDGGSNDDTVKILSEYKHLNWVSEPDRGQSHALNKGFKKAKGDIVVWLNSDDWLPDDTFKTIIPALRTSPLVMGQCQVTDKFGAPSFSTENVERSWIDILKYWIFESVPSQPSIFFTRNLLESVKLPNGDYIEEDLQYAMDQDLWLRMAKKVEFNHRIPKVLSYYRNYETNKTGGFMDAVYREFSEVYRRHSLRESKAAHAFSVVLPLDSWSEGVNSLLSNLRSQSFLDAEIVVVDYSSSQDNSRTIRKQVLELGEQMKPLGLRHIRCLKPNYFAALKQGCKSASANYVCHLRPGSSIEPNFLLTAQHLLHHDNLGLILPNELTWNRPQQDLINQTGSFKIENVFNWPEVMQSFIARKIMLTELDPFEPSPSADNFRQLLLRTLNHGWQIHYDNSLSIAGGLPMFPELQSELSSNSGLINARIILQSETENQRNPFAQHRVQKGFGLRFDPALINSVKQMLATSHLEAPQPTAV